MTGRRRAPLDLQRRHDLDLIALAQWMAKYYGTPLEQIMRSLLPSAVRQETHSAKTRQVAVLANMPENDELEPVPPPAGKSP